jgi:hypothetical protein
MIWMILLVQHLAEATSEDGARPKVTGGTAITPTMQRPGIISFCPYHCDQLASRRQSVSCGTNGVRAAEKKAAGQQLWRPK